MKSSNRNLILTITGILILSVISVIATTTITNNYVSTPTGNFSSSINSNNITINNTGMYYNSNKVSVRTADVVVCRGTSVLDDFLKSFSCDVVCRSTDNDCGDDINTYTLIGNYNIYLSKGLYPLSDSINLSSNISLIGSGIGLTILRLNDAIDRDVITNKNKGLEIDKNILIKNIEIDGNGLQQTSTISRGIYFRNVDNVFIENNKISNTRGFNIGYASLTSNFATTNSLIFNNILNRNLNGLPLSDIIAVECKECIISNNIIKNINGAGITTANMKSIIIESNTLNITDYSFNLEGPSIQTDIKIKNNIVYNNGTGGGILISSGKQTKNIEVLNNNINLGLGFYLLSLTGINTSNIKFNNNIVNKTSSTSELIYLSSNTSDIQIVGNYFDINPSFNLHLIRSYNVTNLKINDNYVSNSGASFYFPGGNINKVSIIGNIIYNPQYSLLYGDNIKSYLTISENTIYNGGISNDATWGNAITCSMCLNSIISNNNLINSTINGIKLRDAAGVTSSNNSIFSNEITLLDYSKSFISMTTSTTNYADTYTYSGVLPPCANYTRFNERIIHNSTSLCFCYNGDWIC